jgi:hypothetical protein
MLVCQTINSNVWTPPLLSPPGINYAKFLKAFDITENKRFFPYEWQDNVSKLEHTSLPPHDSFSSLEYNLCQKVWEENMMTMFKDFLKWYDVGLFVSAVQNL